MTNDQNWGRSDSNRDLRRLKVWSAADYATTPRKMLSIVASFQAHEGCPQKNFSVPSLRRAVGREALESSSAVLQTAANPSQLPAQQKRPGVARDAWPCAARKGCGVTSAKETRPGTAPSDRRGYKAIGVEVDNRAACRTWFPQACSRFA